MHTPGPWFVGENGTKWTVFCSDPREGIRTVGWSAANVRTRTNESAANARLFAAAPELLEALQHERWCRTCHEDGHEKCRDCMYEAAMYKASLPPDWPSKVERSLTG